VFHTRCPLYRSVLSESQQERCRSEVPSFGEVTPGHQVHCHFPRPRADIAAATDEGMGEGAGDPAVATAGDVPPEQRP